MIFNVLQIYKKFQRNNEFSLFLLLFLSKSLISNEL
nr:MAG TPA: hypothetical protein [Caudoviricetes sp.]